MRRGGWIRSFVLLGAWAIAFAAWHIPFAGYVFFDYNLAFGSFLGLARWALGGTAPGVVVHILGNAFYLLTG